MYTSTYSSSSPVRTATLGVGLTNYQEPSSTPNQYSSYQTMNDGGISSRHMNTAYSNSAIPSTALPIRTTTPSNRYAGSYNSIPNDLNANKYPTSSTYRSNTGENELLRSNYTATYGRTRSYEDLVNEQNQIYRSESSIYNSTLRGGSNYNPNSIRQTRPQQGIYDDELIVKSTDLSATFEQEMVELVRGAFRKYDLSSQRELAGYLKRSADKTFSSCWHCIVGRQFSSYVTHEMNGFIYLTKGPLSILLFKSGS